MGIQHEPTAPYSPQSNGKAERLNRTLKTFARAMLYQANMPKSFWAEAMSTAAYLINRLPSEAINDEIPYEKWHQKQLPMSDLRSLKPFGCIVHIHVPEERQKASSKVDTQSTTGCFVGYTKTNTMWRVWDFERKVFVNSHDLIFFETQFPKPSDFDEPPADPYDRSTLHLQNHLQSHGQYSMKSSYNLHLHYAHSKPMDTFNLTTIHLRLSMPCDDPTPNSGGTPSATRSKL